MFERPRKGERAILVHITMTGRFEPATLAEFEDLAQAAEAIIVGQITGTRTSPDPGYFVGKGKLQEIIALVQTQQVEVVLFNHTLTPTQERNLEQSLGCRVVDRTGVILDIFAQRARSFEGKLQVELAQLNYLSTRLVRGWTHLERQRGGIGLRGPGETQLETDRRLIAERIKAINKRLEKVTQQRELGRRARQRAQLPVISLVGYTNAGKSTLFNRLTTAKIYVADQLFATLDATLRRIQLPNKINVIVADTVGFIQQLPHDLIAAFRATLEETCQASLLLHVVDASDAERQLRIEQVNQILADINAAEVPQLIIYNKIDKLPHGLAHEESSNNPLQIGKIWLSARQGSGIDLLSTILAKYFDKAMVHHWVKVPVQAGELRARLFTLGTVLQEQYTDNGDSLLEIQMSEVYFSQLIQAEPALQLIQPLASFSQAS
jgi:GTP-binding protein HflX